MSRARVALVALVLVACGGRGEPPSSATLADTCKVQLAPRAAALAPAGAAPAPPAPRPSRVIAHVDLRVGTLKKELDERVPVRVAEEGGRSIGMAGQLRYTVDRGPFRVAVEGDALVVRTDVNGRAQACLSGNRCYASCEPAATATATVPLRLQPDYRFAPSQVRVAFTRGCVVRALGGLVKVDVTPIVEAQLRPALRRVEQEIDRKLPSLRPHAERLWTALSKPRALPLAGCVALEPRALTQGPVSGTAEALRVRFGLTTSAELRPRCGDAPPAKPLPPVTFDPALPAEDEVELAIATPLAAVGAGLDGSAPFEVGGARARAAGAAASPAPEGLRADVSLRGDVCGDVAVRSGLAWSDDGRALLLKDPRVEAEDAPRLAKAGLDGAALARGLAGARVSLPVAPEALAEVLPQLASAASDDAIEVSARVAGVKPSVAFVRAEEAVAAVRLRGAVELRQR